MSRRKMLNKSVYLMSFIAVLMVAVLCFYPGEVASAVVVPTFDSTAVLDDLQGITIDGKPFNAADYPKDPYGSISALTFMEYCFSQYENTMGNYGLYIYLHNPALIKIDDIHVMNKITMAIEFNEKDMPSKYKKFSLQFCSKSSDGQFYKFKVLDPANDILGVIRDYAVTHGGERCYYVSEVELVETGQYNATAYNVGNQYVYEGFADGYGDSANFPLQMRSLGIETIQTDLHYAFYRPDGESSAGNYTQHQLNSVYFSVPTALVKKYGLLSAVHMEWYEYLTKDILVMGNQEVYNAFKSIVGKNVNADDSGTDYGITTSISSGTTWYDGDTFYNLSAFYNPIFDNKIDVLYYLFSTYGKEASSYTVPSAELLEYIRTYEGSGEKLNGKYYKELFEDFVDTGRTIGYNELTVKSDDKLSLTSYKLDQNWFEKLFGIKNYDLTVYNEISGITAVSDLDTIGTKSTVCSKLYIDESNYEEFMEFYSKTKNGAEERTVYLLRYAVTDYYSVPVNVVKRNTGATGVTNFLKKIDENAYLARQTAFLDLDLIDITFQDEDGVLTVIPVCASPIDGVGSVSSPVNSSQKTDWKKIIGVILGILILIILLIIFAPILPYIIRAILWIVSIPFKLIGGIFKAIKSLSKRE